MTDNMGDAIALSPDEVAKRLGGISRQRVYAAIRSGHLIARACGRRSLIDIQDVRDWLRSLPPTKSSKGYSDAQPRD